MKTSKSIIRVIDKYFDKYKGIYTPYEIETNATLLSFFKKTYALLKNNNAFDDEELVKTYIDCTKAAVKTIRFIENSKIYKFKFTLDSTKGNPKAYAFLDCVENLSNRYTNRNYDKKLLEEEQKIGYNHYYDENIYLSKGLVPSYNENEEGSVEFKIDDNPNLIKICLDGSYIIWKNKVAKKYSNYQNFKDQIISMDKDDSLLDFYQTVRQVKDAEQNTEYFVTFAFEDGFTVNANNEYEQNNGLLLELFQYVQKSFENKTNILEKYLKQYFYNTLVEKYRTKEIVDKETHLRTNDISSTNNFMAFPKIYETLMGKAGKIGSSNTIDYDINNSAYIKFPFKSSILKTDGRIYFYINKKFLNDNLNLIKNYDKIDYDVNGKSFLYSFYNKNATAIQSCTSEYTNYFDNINDYGEIGNSETGKDSNKQAARYIKIYGDKLKEQILKQNFFAITPKFTPDVNDFLTSYYFQNAKKIEKEFYYNENYSSSILDITFDRLYMILSLQTELRPDKNVDFGSGVLNTRKTQQKFYDNIVSCVSQSYTTSKDSNFKSKEFSSLFDDRETIVVATSDTIVTTNQYGYANVRYDETGTYFVEAEFPKFKDSMLYRKGNELWLECSDFSEHNDINSINQVRIILKRDNTKRLLFNVDRVENEYIPTKVNMLEIDIKTPEEFNISYISNNGLIISDNTNGLNTSVEKEIVSIDGNAYENVYIQKEDNDYYFEFTPVNEITESYLFDDEIIFNRKEISLKEDTNGQAGDYILIINGEKKEKTEYEINKYLVLKENSYTIKSQIGNQEECQILDYVSVMGNPKRKELGQYVYNSLYDNVPSAYEKEHEKIFLKIYPIKKNISIYNKGCSFGLEKQNVLTVHRNLNNKVIKVSNNLSWYSLPTILYLYPKIYNIKPKKTSQPYFGLSAHKRADFGNIVKMLKLNNKGLFINGKFTKKSNAILAEKYFNNYEINKIIAKYDIKENSIGYDFRKDKFFIMHTNIGHPFKKSIIFSENAYSYDQIKQISLKEDKNIYDYSRSGIFKLISENFNIVPDVKNSKVDNNGFNFITEMNSNNLSIYDFKEAEHKIENFKANIYSLINPKININYELILNEHKS